MPWIYFGGALAEQLATLQHSNAAILAGQTAIQNALKTLSAQGAKMATALDGLTASVASNTTVIGSAITLINGFSAALAAAGTDPVKLGALQASLDTSDTALAAAVAANTPAATPPAGGGAPPVG